MVNKIHSPYLLWKYNRKAKLFKDTNLLTSYNTGNIVFEIDCKKLEGKTV